jgi:hypothetical protein
MFTIERVDLVINYQPPLTGHPPSSTGGASRRVLPVPRVVGVGVHQQQQLLPFSVRSLGAFLVVHKDSGKSKTPAEGHSVARRPPASGATRTSTGQSPARPAQAGAVWSAGRGRAPVWKLRIILYLNLKKLFIIIYFICF